MNISVDYIAIGKRIRNARKNKGLTQEKVAEFANVSPNYITIIEKGTSKPSLQVLILIAKVLDTTTDALLYDNFPILTDSYDADAKMILSDCNEKEKAYLLSLMKYAKEQLREKGLK